MHHSLLQEYGAGTLESESRAWHQIKNEPELPVKLSPIQISGGPLELPDQYTEKFIASLSGFYDKCLNIT